MSNKLSFLVSSYKYDNSDSLGYYDNNWIIGCIKINSEVFYKMELLQVEELTQLINWIDSVNLKYLKDSEFVFIDSIIRFRVEGRENEVNLYVVKFEGTQELRTKLDFTELVALKTQLGELVQIYKLRQQP